MARLYKLSRLSTAALVLLSLVACTSGKDKKDDTTGTEDEDTTFGEDGTDSNAADTDAQLVASSLVAAAPGVLGVASFGTGNLATADVGDGVKTIYVPRACAEGVQTGENEAKYTFNNCLGPNGLTGLTGTVVAHFSADATKLHLDLTYTDVKVNGATIDGSASADITALDTVSRTMTWTATLDGMTARNKPFTYTSKHIVSWKLGEACFALEGTTEGQVRNRDIKTEVQDFHRCRRGCPDDGGKIIITNVAKNKVVTIAFDGTAKATLIGPNGKSGPLFLLCKP